MEMRSGNRGRCLSVEAVLRERGRIPGNMNLKKEKKSRFIYPFLSWASRVW